MKQILGSAYLLGANTEQLTKIYESESEELEQWQDSPGEISKADWRDFLGKRKYATVPTVQSLTAVSKG